MEWTSQTDRKLQYTTAGMQALQTTALNDNLQTSQTKGEVTIWDEHS